MADTDNSERRHDPRLPIELKVEYRKLNTFFADYTKNICKGGTFIRTDKPLQVGTEFLFRLVVPRLKEPLTLRGQVRWIKIPGEPSPPGVPEDHEPGMGIRFVYETVDEQRMIEEIVEKMMIGSFGQLVYSKLIAESRRR